MDSSNITTEQRHERSTEFWNRTRWASRLEERLRLAAEQKRQEVERQEAEALETSQRAQEERREAEAERKRQDDEHVAAEAAAAAEKLEEERQAQKKREAEAELAKTRKHEAAQEQARKSEEQKVRTQARSSGGLLRYLKNVDDSLILNQNGNKYRTVDFNHLAHASNKYLPQGNFAQSMKL